MQNHSAQEVYLCYTLYTVPDVACAYWSAQEDHLVILAGRPYKVFSGLGVWLTEAEV